MKVTLLNNISEEERSVFENSNVYSKSLEKSKFSNLVIEYNKEYFSKDFKDTSLLLWNKNEPIIYIPSFSKEGIYSFFGSPIDVFESGNQRESIAEGYKFLLKYLTEYLKRENFERLLFNDNSYFLCEFYSKIKENSDSQLGVIDLSNEVSFIKSCFRKSYKSLINWGDRELNTTIITHENFNDEVITEFRNFHISIAGKETRNIDTWRLQGEMIKNKEGFIVRSEYQDKLASISFYQHGSKEILYGVGVYDRKLMDENLPMAHFSLFTAIQKAKELGLEYMLLGDINSLNPNHKEAQIAKFKKGFVNQCIVVKNYNVSFKE